MSKRPIVTTAPIATPADMTNFGLLALMLTKNELANQLQMLLDTAHELGYVITVETVPLAPPAMGNYAMRGDVRVAR